MTISSLLGVLTLADEPAHLADHASSKFSQNGVFSSEQLGDGGSQLLTVFIEGKRSIIFVIDDRHTTTEINGVNLLTWSNSLLIPALYPRTC